MGKPTGSKSGQGAGRGAPVKGQKPPSGQAITAAADAIASAFKKWDEQALVSALGRASVDDVKRAMELVGYKYKGSKSRTARFLVNSVREWNKQKIRH